MMKHLLLLLLCFFLLLPASCGLMPNGTVDPGATVEAAVQQTAAVQLTAFAETAAWAVPGTTPTPVVVQTATPPEQTPPPTEVPVLRDIALLFGVVSVGAETEVFPGERFDVIWRIRNVGETDWNGDYSLVIVSGDPMGAPERIPLRTAVAIGEIIELRLKLTAPEALGSHTALWLLENDQGKTFGLDDAGQLPLQVDIAVIENPLRSAQNQVFRFYEGFTTAQWVSQQGSALCEAEGDIGTYGLVYRDNQPEIQNGVIENEPSLVMIPAEGEDGFIAGIFPPFKVKAGDYFVTFIGCLHKGTFCDVTFRLDYLTVGEDQPHTFAEWEQTHTGQWIEVRKNLTQLDGMEVQFILVVENNGASLGDYAVWFVPAIYR
ncbi:MAG: hypothetical protein HPY85_06225 [Anaerolineae bacterium]|nr:hypothetical protein [Anaerolineae bacterium]